MQKKLTLESTIVQTSQILSSNIDDETILLSIENSKYYGMASTGSRIWELLSEPITVNGIVDTLLAEYEIDREQCTAEVLGFLGELLVANLIAFQE